MSDIIINFFHLLAAAVWLGGAIFIKLVLNPSLAQINPQERGKLMGTAAKRFSITAWISIIILIITGLLKTPSDMLFDVSSDFGIFLTIKIVSVIAVVIIGLIIAFKIVPALRKSTPEPGGKPSGDFLKYNRRLEIFSMISTILGILILLWATFLW